MGTQNLLTAGMDRWERGSELPVTKELEPMPSGYELEKKIMKGSSVYSKLLRNFDNHGKIYSKNT